MPALISADGAAKVFLRLWPRREDKKSGTRAGIGAHEACDIEGKAVMSADKEKPLEMLQSALAEAQATVRAYDTKAQIVGIGYIFALGIIGQFQNWFPTTGEVDLAQVIIAWCVVVLPIVLFGFVLYPTRKMMGGRGNHAGSVLYVVPDRFAGPDEVIEAAKQCRPEQEVAYELLKVSQLRELKRQRFLRALFAGALCFVVLFGFQILRVI